jgi:hypothetical protein
MHSLPETRTSLKDRVDAGDRQQTVRHGVTRAISVLTQEISGCKNGAPRASANLV